ncbi:response regulator [Scytonema sp. UIC 10036]|uniref:response regulator n=1 Tax=Scytonema sp. UIC 10036 TaxID=2304196 RepID=UPI0012DA327F|nr:response regulator [Scytonema sp. UIC 10036]MUG98327.1 response regulator [Scytonema sp. UIC 10036]
MNFALNNNLKAEILVVNDTLTTLDWLVNVLQKNNYQVHLATDGYSALEIAKTKLPDLILLDIILPDMSGYSICQQLKKSIQTSEIPIIFTSGVNEGLDVAKAFQVGVADYIIKP